MLIFVLHVFKSALACIQIPLYSDRVLHISSTTIGIIFAVCSVVTTITTSIFGTYATEIGYTKLIAFGFWGLIVGMTMLITANSVVTIALAMAAIWVGAGTWPILGLPELLYFYFIFFF
jgi:hypothetical protein